MVGLSDSILALESVLDMMKDTETQIKNMKKQLYDLMIENRVKTWITPNGTRLTRVDAVPAKMVTEEKLDIAGLKRDLPELFRPDYDGGYMKEEHVKKSGRSGFVKITKGSNDNE